MMLAFIYSFEEIEVYTKKDSRKKGDFLIEKNVDW